jgi:TrmH family RNA methyltransferase
MGSAFRIPVIAFANAQGMLNALKENKYTTYAAVLDKNSICLGEFSFDKKSAVLIGNEANGINNEIVSKCDNTLYIPMKGNAESLNAATAANIIMWEMTK